MSDPSSYTIYPDILKFAVGVGTGYVLHIARLIYSFKENELTSRINDLCDRVSEAADLGTDYWLSGTISGSSEDVPDLLKLEAKIFGLNHYILATTGYLADQWPQLDTSFEKYLHQFADDLTGGEFQSKDRQPDFQRSQSVQFSGMELSLALRKARSSYTGRWLKSRLGLLSSEKK